MLSIQELCDRYDVTRNRIYARKKKLETLGIDIPFVRKNNKSFATEASIKVLDQQNEWLKNGGLLSNFSLSIEPEVTVLSPRDSVPRDSVLPPRYNNSDTLQRDTTIQFQQGITIEQIKEVAIALRDVYQPDQFAYLDRLKFLAETKIKISSSELQKLIGIVPRGIQINRGSFTFLKRGKIGRQSAWQVKLNQPENMF